MRASSSSHLGRKQAVALSETENPSQPPHAGCRSEAHVGKAAGSQINIEKDAFTESPRDQNTERMLKEFRRQDRVTMLTLAAFFVSLCAILAVWSLYYNQ